MTMEEARRSLKEARKCLEKARKTLSLEERVNKAHGITMESFKEIDKKAEKRPKRPLIIKWTKAGRRKDIRRITEDENNERKKTNL